MKHAQNFFFIFLLVPLFISCKKNGSGTECFAGRRTVMEITDRPATVKVNQGSYYLVEQNAIDPRLVPCNLAAEFQVDNLAVTVSGNVKSKEIVSSTAEPCCVNDFVITKISR